MQCISVEYVKNNRKQRRNALCLWSTVASRRHLLLMGTVPKIERAAVVFKGFLAFWNPCGMFDLLLFSKAPKQWVRVGISPPVIGAWRLWPLPWRFIEGFRFRRILSTLCKVCRWFAMFEFGTGKLTCTCNRNLCSTCRCIGTCHCFGTQSAFLGDSQSTLADSVGFRSARHQASKSFTELTELAQRLCASNSTLTGWRQNFQVVFTWCLQMFRWY